MRIHICHISYHDISTRSLPFGGLIQPEWSDVQIDRFIRAMHFPPFEAAANHSYGELTIITPTTISEENKLDFQPNN